MAHPVRHRDPASLDPGPAHVSAQVEV
jgi:hypothetical protein